MQFHDLKPTHRFKKGKRVGRGGKRGTYSGKGQKGQKSRAGAKLKPMEREFVMRIPKLRGIKFKRKMPNVFEINVGELGKRFESGEKVTPRTLQAKGFMTKAGGQFPVVKVLGEGEVKKKLFLVGFEVSKSAEEKIKAAGGSVHSGVK